MQLNVSYYHEIYPEELQLTKENVVNSETNFLDLHIQIKNGVLTTSLYDKRENFGFTITEINSIRKILKNGSAIEFKEQTDLKCANDEYIYHTSHRKEFFALSEKLEEFCTKEYKNIIWPIRYTKTSRFNSSLPIRNGHKTKNR